MKFDIKIFNSQNFVQEKDHKSSHLGIFISQQSILIFYELFNMYIAKDWRRVLSRWYDKAESRKFGPDDRKFADELSTDFVLG